MCKVIIYYEIDTSDIGQCPEDIVNNHLKTSKVAGFLPADKFYEDVNKRYNHGF